MTSTTVLLAEVNVPDALGRPLDVNEAADRLEQTLSGMSLPVRIQGGLVHEGGVRYVATPMNGTRVEQLQQAEGPLADALGVRQVHVAREGDDLAIEVRDEDRSWPRLLTILETLGDRPPLTAVAGREGRGLPVLISMVEPDTWHVAVLGGAGVGKSELLRSLMISLALMYRQSMVQLFGIDLGGRELAVLEAVPHGLTDLATEPRFAAELMLWLMEEGTRRERHAIRRPDLVLAVDDVSRVIQSDPSAAGRLRQLAVHGRRWGIHLILGDSPSAAGAPRPWDHKPGWAVVKAEDRPGRFALITGIRAIPFTAAWLSAADLDLAVRQARTGRRASEAGLVYSIARRDAHG